MRRVKRQHLLAARAAGLVGLRLRPRATSRTGDAEDDGATPLLVHTEAWGHVTVSTDLPLRAAPQGPHAVPLESVTKFCYDSPGTRTVVTDGVTLGPTTTFCYDSLGRRLATTDPGQCYRVTSCYDANGRLVSITHNGRLLSITHGASGADDQEPPSARPPEGGAGDRPDADTADGAPGS
jgi:hypothetical protein